MRRTRISLLFFFFRFSNVRLLQRSNNDNIIRTEFIFLLYPDVRLDKEIRTFRNELFRSSIKKTLLKSHQYLHAFKLSSFFHVIDQLIKHLFQINVVNCLRYPINMFIHYIKYSILSLNNVNIYLNDYYVLFYIRQMIILYLCQIMKQKRFFKLFLIGLNNNLNRLVCFITKNKRKISFYSINIFIYFKYLMCQFYQQENQFI